MNKKKKKKIINWYANKVFKYLWFVRTYGMCIYPPKTNRTLNEHNTKILIANCFIRHHFFHIQCSFMNESAWFLVIHFNCITINKWRKKKRVCGDLVYFLTKIIRNKKNSYANFDLTEDEKCAWDVLTNFHQK